MPARVLIVDDEPEIRDILSEALRQAALTARSTGSRSRPCITSA